MYKNEICHYKYAKTSNFLYRYKYSCYNVAGVFSINFQQQIYYLHKLSVKTILAQIISWVSTWN